MPDNTLDNDFIKHIAGDGKIELCLYSQRSKAACHVGTENKKTPTARAK